MTSLNVADAKKHLSEILGRVAYGGETILITRRGEPMAKLVPPEGDNERGPLVAEDEEHLADVEGWLDDDDPFFAAIDEIVEARARHTPRVLGNAGSTVERLEP